MPTPTSETLNLADLLLDSRVREGLGAKTALVVCLPGQAARSFSYGQVQALANRYARRFQDLGLRQEERVLLALPDGLDFVGALFGVLKAGGVAVMANPQLSQDDVAGLYPFVRPHLAVVDSQAKDTFEGARRGAWPRHFLIVDEASEPPEADEAFATVPTHRNDPALWLFSGGTTGRPKAVVQSHAAFANTTELYAKAVAGYRASDRTLSVPKLYFGYATGSNLFFPFAVGGSAILFPEHPTPEVLFEMIRRHQPTILINVPTLINRMLAHSAAAAQDLSCLRFATSAGEALPVPLYERWKETFGVELLDGLGTAEMWHIFLTNRLGQVRPGTLGQVVPGFDVRVRDEEGRDLPDGEVGRLWVAGASRALAYWQDQEQSQDAFRGPWYVSGDLVRRDADGYFTYCGRANDVIKVGGKWLEPAEVESCLMTHPGVKECAVIGAPDQDGLTKPFAFVVAKGDATNLADLLKAFTLERLQAYKHPRRITLLDDFPRTHLGKIDRAKLKTMC